jgi:hypothetical protein
MDRTYETRMTIEEEPFKRKDGTDGIAYHFHITDAYLKHNVRDRESDRVTSWFRNFRGQQTPCNHEGDRNFMWEFEDPELADALKDDWGFNVKSYTYPSGETTYQLKVNVKFRGRFDDPKIYLESDTAPRVLVPEECLGDLDFMFFQHVDFTFVLSKWNTNGRHGSSAYLEDMLVYKKPERRMRDRYATVKYSSYEESEA